MKSRSQQFLDAIEAGDPSLLPSPITREERFLHALSTGEEITPTTFEEQFMQAARAFKGGGSGDDDSSGSNLFKGIYHTGYYVESSGLVPIGSTARFFYVPVTEGLTYLIGRTTPSDRFVFVFLNAEPILDGVKRNTAQGGFRDVPVATLATTAVAPVGSSFLAVFVSYSSQEPISFVMDTLKI